MAERAGIAYMPGGNIIGGCFSLKECGRLKYTSLTASITGSFTHTTTTPWHVTGWADSVATFEFNLAIEKTYTRVRFKTTVDATFVDVDFDAFAIMESCCGGCVAFCFCSIDPDTGAKTISSNWFCATVKASYSTRHTISGDHSHTRWPGYGTDAGGSSDCSSTADLGVGVFLQASNCKDNTLEILIATCQAPNSTAAGIYTGLSNVCSDPANYDRAILQQMPAYESTSFAPIDFEQTIASPCTPTSSVSCFGETTFKLISS